LISRETISKIHEAARIEEVVGEFVNLKKSGQNYKGLSPFTDEKNPSFFVSPGKNIFKCFSTGKGGNAVKFLMELEHFTYPEALRFLAKKYDIHIEEAEQTPEEIEEMNEREALYHITAFAQKYFSEILMNDEKGKAIGLQYFKDREFREDTIEKFQLGYSPDEWEAFTKHALDNGYKSEYLEKTGLTIAKGDRKYDRFRGRVIFPIHNLSGRVLGFGGRTLLSDDNIPKYVNSPESDIYNKSKILYGLYFAKNAIIREENCFLVEGYTDVISMHQAGIENVVSSSGTALTVDQIKLIKRYASNITILYDGDAAGVKASFRGIDMILEEGMNVRIVLFPDNEDPDSYARKHRRVELEDLINNNANDFIRFKTGLLLEEAADDPIKKAGLIKEIVTSISLIPDAVYRNVYVKECSSLLDISEQALMNELNKLLRIRYKKHVKQQEQPQEPPPDTVEYTAEKQLDEDPVNAEHQERDLVRILLMYGNNEIVLDEVDEDNRPVENSIEVARFVVNELKRDDIRFHNDTYQKILDKIVEVIENEEIADEQMFLNHEDESLSEATLNLVYSPYELSDQWSKNRIEVSSERDQLKKAVLNTILAYKARLLEKQIFDKQEELKSAQNEEDIQIFLGQLRNLKSISKQINEQLGRVVIR